MSSNIRIARICQFCGQEFEAKTTITKYCSHKCNSRALKAKIRNEKVGKSNEEVLIVKTKPIEVLKAKEFLTVKDAATLLNCAKQTIYTLINSGKLPATNIKLKKTLIRKIDIDNLFNQEPIELIEIKTKPIHLI